MQIIVIIIIIIRSLLLTAKHCIYTLCCRIELNTLNVQDEYVTLTYTNILHTSSVDLQKTYNYCYGSSSL